MSTSTRWFRLDRHDVRSTLNASIRAIMQNGLLERAFQDALVPRFLYAQIAESEPWSGNLGDTKTMTRTGLLSPVTTAITGSDPSAATYGIEQWSVTMDQYGNSVDTNMLQSAMTLQSKYLRDVQTLGINAGQSINQVARNKLFSAYAGGRTWCTTTDGASNTSITVANTAGFTTVLVNGVPTPVSVSNPLNITINGVANTVTGVAGSVLTLGTGRTDAAGDYVVSSAAPVSIRPTGNTAYDLTSANIATLANFRAAVARLRTMNVPDVGGYYVAHIDPTTEAELFADTDFKQALQGRVDSPIYRDLSIGRFAGIDWVRNNEAPTVTSNSGATVHRALVMGAGALIAAPFADMGSLLGGTGVEDIPSIRMVQAAPSVDVALIVRPPQDRLQQNISTTWSWVGDFGVPSDSGTGDAALYKRAVMIEHC